LYGALGRKLTGGSLERAVNSQELSGRLHEIYEPAASTEVLRSGHIPVQPRWTDVDAANFFLVTLEGFKCFRFKGVPAIARLTWARRPDSVGDTCQHGRLAGCREDATAGLRYFLALGRGGAPHQSP
jgi:hypothetical protein